MAGKMVIPETRQGLSASRELLPLSLLRDGLEKLREDEVKVLTKEATLTQPKHNAQRWRLQPPLKLADVTANTISDLRVQQQQ